MEKLKLPEILKNKHILRLCIILFIGTVLLLLGGNKQTQAPEPTLPTQQPYAETERRLEHILGQMQGVGAVEVMITYEGTGKRSYVADVSREQLREESRSNVSESTSVVLPKDAPVLEAETYPKVRGVIAVCEGAGSAAVREQVILALKAVLNVEEHRIGVFTK